MVSKLSRWSINRSLGSKPRSLAPQELDQVVKTENQDDFPGLAECALNGACCPSVTSVACDYDRHGAKGIRIKIFFGRVDLVLGDWISVVFKFKHDVSAAEILRN